MKTSDRICVAVGAGVLAGLVAFGVVVWEGGMGDMYETPAQCLRNPMCAAVCGIAAFAAAVFAWGITGRGR